MDEQKPFELIYSRQKTNFLPGRAYANPRFFTGPRTGVTKVLIVGEWPEIETAYRAIGVPVVMLDTSGAVAAAPQPSRRPPPEAEPPASLTPAPEAPDERAKVYIPEYWRDLPWVARPDHDLTLRSVAAMVSDTPVLNKAQAVAAVTAELARRAGAETPEA